MISGSKVCGSRSWLAQGIPTWCQCQVKSLYVWATLRVPWIKDGNCRSSSKCPRSSSSLPSSKLLWWNDASFTLVMYLPLSRAQLLWSCYSFRAVGGAHFGTVCRSSRKDLRLGVCQRCQSCARLWRSECCSPSL